MGFTPETPSTPLALANEKLGAVGDDNADPWLPAEPSVTSSLQLGRLERPALLLGRSLEFPEARLPALSREDAWLGALLSSILGGEYGTRRMPSLLLCEWDRW